MRLQDFDAVDILRKQLAEAGTTLDAFERHEGDTVQCLAYFGSTDYGKKPSASINVLPIPKSQAVSAAQRAYNKIVDELAQLGVNVEK